MWAYSFLWDPESDYSLCFGQGLQFSWQSSEDEVELVVALWLVHWRSAAPPQQPQLKVCLEHLQQVFITLEPWTQKTQMGAFNVVCFGSVSTKCDLFCFYLARSSVCWLCRSVRCVRRCVPPQGGAAWCRSPGRWSPRAPPPQGWLTDAPSKWGEAAGGGHRSPEERRLQVESKGEQFLHLLTKSQQS